MNVIEFINGVQSRPLMYLENKSLQEFYYLIKGFLGAKFSNNIFDLEDEFFEERFTDFLRKKYQSNDINWKKILEMESNNNSLESYECFSKNFEEWLIKENLIKD